MKVFMITSEWPTAEHPARVPFLVREVQQLRNQGVHIEIFPFRGHMQPGNYLRAWAEVRFRLRTQYFDLIHAQFGQSGLLVLGTTQLPLVVTFRGSDLNGFVGSNGKMALSGRVLRKFSQLVSLQADEIILVSKGLARFLPCKQYHVIPSGLDLNLFRPIDKTEARAHLGLNLERNYVLFAGNPANPIKRFHLAQQSLALVKSNRYVELLVASDVSPTDMPFYINAADVLLLTSAHEGSPNVVKEALACNLPVVSVDVGDVSERIANLDGCIICSNDRPETIGNALQRILAQSIPLHSRHTVQDLDGLRIAKQIIGVYDLAMGC